MSGFAVRRPDAVTTIKTLNLKKSKKKVDLFFKTWFNSVKSTCEACLMKISSNLLRLCFMVIIATMTVIVILVDTDRSAQDAATHTMALSVGALLHSLGGSDESAPPKG